MKILARKSVAPAIAAVLVIVALLPIVRSVRPVQAQETTPQAAALQNAFATREAVYQDQLAQIQQAFAEHQATYQQQIDEMNRRLTQGQGKVQMLANQEQAILQQVAQLQAVRTQRQAQYQSQLDAARVQYAERAVMINSQLVDVQARLAEANTMLGR